MVENNQNDMKVARANIQKALIQRYKRSFWDQFKDFIGIFFLAIFILIVIIGIIVLFVTLIENPISLAILCATIFLIIERFCR